ncbi:MAG: response regulator [Bdellovibrio sp. ArHS]|uniref:winged helix-turn-helix domain-containing protein n=1 Tax=Bdellovibrio sp. ArHS TaxID=1569284 RepID=UPI000583BB92|nr:helix-turn-helix domain-containing protein [Bdellovibrio sp. ArHS]KHD89974.1 MAG: response regulator [Bdellovibrio sp. ArHS]
MNAIPKTPPLLQLARLQVRQGDLLEARATTTECLVTFNKEAELPLWFEAARIHLQANIELENVGGADVVMNEVLQLLSAKNLSAANEAKAETMLGSWLRAQGKTEESQAYIDSAITKATGARDLETLARALLFSAFSLLLEPKKHNHTLLTLDKVDVLLSEAENTELTLTSLLLRGYIYTQSVQFDRAMDVLWRGYELAKQHGFQLLISSILAQMARVYRDQKRDEQYRIYAELAIKGVSPIKSPRLYKFITQVCPHDLDSLRSQYDFQVDEKSRLVLEKTKGVINFKNQHILLDMALLFIKNPGQRYSKEDLVEKIWGQAYNPELHDNLIYVSIKRLRTLLEPDLESPRYILRDRKGYFFNPQATVQMKYLEEATL